MSEAQATAEFDWGAISEERWREFQADVGADDRQLKFAAAYFRCGSMSQAGREAGYGSADTLRQAASNAHKTKTVQQLLSLARGDARGAGDDMLTDEEAMRILTRMAKSGDANSRIRAIEQIGKMKLAAAEERRRLSEAEMAPEHLLDGIAELLPPISVLFADALARQHRIEWKPKAALATVVGP